MQSSLIEKLKIEISMKMASETLFEMSISKSFNSFDFLNSPQYAPSCFSFLLRYYRLCLSAQLCFSSL